MSNIYKDHGYESRTDYLHRLAADHGCSLELVYNIADTLGSSEDFDALPLYLADCCEMGAI
jgi:hypothetical protein